MGASIMWRNLLMGIGVIGSTAIMFGLVLWFMELRYVAKRERKKDERNNS